jgi:hypothetical protein
MAGLFAAILSHAPKKVKTKAQPKYRVKSKGRVGVMNTSTKLLYMSLILLVAATLVTGCASRAGAVAPGGGLAASSSSSNGLLAVDTLWSTGGRATGPAIRTPADGPGRSRLVP